MPTALSFARCAGVVADYERRGYACVRDTSLGVVLRHPNGGVVTVLANGETRAGDRAGPSQNSATTWWAEPSYAEPAYASPVGGAPAFSESGDDEPDASAAE